MIAELFDTHCHIDDERFNDDREEVISSMRENGVFSATAVGFDMPSSRSVLSFAQINPMFYAAVGIHPHEAKDFRQENLDELKRMVKEERCVALGEIGLDYYYDLSDRPKQREVCALQMDLAYETGMPVIYHIRDAHEDMLTMMKQRKSRLSGGIIHCFSASVEQAKQYLDLGFYISFAGPVTFKKAPKQWEAAAYVPLDRILVETDAPYLSPEPVRGRRNEPANVRYVAHKIAQIKEIPFEVVANATTENAKRIYRIG